jgi:DNA-binding phage protein
LRPSFWKTEIRIILPGAATDRYFLRVFRKGRRQKMRRHYERAEARKTDLIMFGGIIEVKKLKYNKIGTDPDIHHRLFEKLMKNKSAQDAYNSEEVMFNFIEDIKKEMVRKHLTNYALAKKAAIDHQVLARILSGQKNAEVATLAKVARGVGARLELVLQKQGA